MAAVGLNSNPGVIFFVFVTKIVLSLLVLPIFGLLFFSYTNGEVVPNGEILFAASHSTCAGKKVKTQRILMGGLAVVIRFV